MEGGGGKQHRVEGEVDAQRMLKFTYTGMRVSGAGMAFWSCLPCGGESLPDSCIVSKQTWKRCLTSSKPLVFS